MIQKHKPQKENPEDIHPQGEDIKGTDEKIGKSEDLRSKATRVAKSILRYPFKKKGATNATGQEELQSHEEVEITKKKVDNRKSDDIQKPRFIHLKIDDATSYKTLHTTKFINRKVWNGPPDPYEIRAHIPGTIVKIYVQEGDNVVVGQRLLILEAMKMKNNIMADTNGIVKEVKVVEGQHVGKNAILLKTSINKD